MATDHNLFSIRLFSVVLNNLGCHERRSASKTLGARRQHGTTNSIVGQLDDGWNDATVRVGSNQRPDENVLRLQVTVDDLTTVQVVQC